MKNALTFLIVLSISNITIQELNGQMTHIAVQLDKTNVIYKGVDNPLRIVSSLEYDSVHVTNYCKIAKADSTHSNNYIIRCNTEKKCDIELFSRGEIIARNSYRTQRIPDPIVKWGNKRTGDSISVNEARNYVLLPEMEEFDFPVFITIQSFEILFALESTGLLCRREVYGNIIPSDIASKFGNGKVLFFNIALKMSDGTTRIQEALFTIK